MPTLTVRTCSPIPIEAECITPDNLAPRSVAEIERLTVQHGNAVVPLAEFFAVRAEPLGDVVIVVGDCSRVKWLGARMSHGTLSVHGDVGMHAGAEMVGGTLHVHGHAADWAGAEMRGGLLHLHGDAGSLVGAAYRGSRVGMRGGTIVVEGRAGHEVGANLRRGVIAIGGDVGDFAGVGLIAGSIVVRGGVGVRPGAGMKRGTIAVLRRCPALLPTIRLCCEYRPTFLALIRRHLEAIGFRMPAVGSVRRFCGDLVALGKGEILDASGGNS